MHTFHNRCCPNRRLDLSGNALRQLPPGLYHCTHLAELRLGDNKLTIAAFPEEFTSLSRLTCKWRCHAKSNQSFYVTYHVATTVFSRSCLRHDIWRSLFCSAGDRHQPFGLRPGEHSTSGAAALVARLQSCEGPARSQRHLPAFDTNKVKPPLQTSLFAKGHLTP